MKRGRKRIALPMLLCSFILAASVLLPAVSASASVPTDSLVYVGGFDENDELQFLAFGTAMTVDGELRILTANGPKELSYKVAPAYGASEVDAEIYTSRAEHGLMFVSLSGPLPGLEAASTYSAKEIEEGAFVETEGRNGVSSESYEARIDSINGNTISFTLDGSSDCLGAPLCYSDGSVFAIVTSSDGGSQGKATIVDVFQANGGSGGLDAGTGGSEKLQDQLMKFGIPAIVVIALVGGFLLYRSKTKKTAQPAAANMGVPNSPPSDTFAQPPSDVIVIGQSQAPSSTFMSTQPVAAPQANLSGVRGTGGQYNTMSFPVKDRVVLGRDSTRCNIIFEATAPGVSSVHCEIIRVGQGLQIVDRGSSYGTFVNGSKLQVNVPADLMPGGGFYLGDKRNSFTVY